MDGRDWIGLGKGNGGFSGTLLRGAYNGGKRGGVWEK